MSYRIIIDSCGELLDEWKNDTTYEPIPFTMTVDGVEIIDDETFDQADFLRRVAASPECPKSACPSPGRYLQALQRYPADHYYIVAITGNLSGSYNSAVLSISLFRESHPDAKAHAFNSCSASVGETLIAMKIRECEEKGLSFEEVVSTVDAYIESQNTFFILENLDTLRKNGRLNGMKSLVVSALKIKPIMCATPEGEIQQLSQARGINKAVAKMADYMVESTGGAVDRIIAISHCNCRERAEQLKSILEKRGNWKKILILEMAGLSSMYANDGGIIAVI